MELLRIEHEDFALSIECSGYEGVWQKASQNVGLAHMTSTYSWSDGVSSVVKYGLDGEEISIVAGDDQSPAIFFDNTDYPIWVEFGEGVSRATFGSLLQSESDHFIFHKRHRILSGFLNFGNDIGRSELILRYEVRGIVKDFTFAFDVLSTKLNYHAHWRSIIEDIEAEYSMLSLDYMRRTFHGFSVDSEGVRPDLVWWSVFQGQQERFLREINRIVEQPRRRLMGTTRYMRADQIRRIPSSVENELVEHRHEENHLYRIDYQVHSNDTQENRFLKFALKEIAKKYKSLKDRIEDLRNVSDSFIEDMDETMRSLEKLKHHPFFRSVGVFKELTQESLVLQKATGYAEVYRTWNLLRRAYSLNEGIFRLQTKDIATLYEIWCFIEVSHIVKEQLGLTIEEVEHPNRSELSGMFTWDLEQGEHSRILFKKDGVELAELVYNPKHAETDDGVMGMANVVVRTVPQKPDIVLQLIKDDIQTGMKMTYLFDAKYRIDHHQNSVDYPPDDAINQMHRYRDAIYYKKDEDLSLKKEVVGGYILFPGSGDPLSVQAAKFFESIKAVNIGAFPLKPKDRENRQLLSDFIELLISNEGQSLIEGSIPQKGLNYIIDGAGVDGDMVFMGYVKEPKEGASDEYREYYRRFKENDHPEFYYSGSDLSANIDLRTIRYVYTSVPGDGYYRVKRVYSERRNMLFSDMTEQRDKSMRIIFELGEFVALSHCVSFNYYGTNHALKVSGEGRFVSLKHLLAEIQRIS